VAELAGILAAAAVAWFVLDSLRARERAVAHGRRACERGEVLFLDDTVQCVRTRFGRDEDGRFAVRRRYLFEFSETGNNRRKGVIVMLGPQLESLEMEPYGMAATVHRIH
jgi:hypothetical protein